MTDRTHYVYEAIDANGVSLYIGCTGNPKQRYRTHMSGNGSARGWFNHFVARWRVSGPYPKAVALAIEAERINDKQPVWNGSSRNNAHPEQRLINEYLVARGVRFIGDPMGRRPRLVTDRSRARRGSRLA